MMAIDSEIRFSRILLGREPADEQELLYVYAALLGHAMDLTAQRVSLMTPGPSCGIRPMSEFDQTDVCMCQKATGSKFRNH
jgi:hypothetical protein